MAVATLGRYQTDVNLAEKFEVSPKQIAAWKARLFKRRTEVFGANAAGRPARYTDKIESKTSGYPMRNYF